MLRACPTKGKWHRRDFVFFFHRAKRKCDEGLSHDSFCSFLQLLVARKRGVEQNPPALVFLAEKSIFRAL